MRKILALLCFVAIIATAVPAFAEDSSTVTLTPAQLEKLDKIQSDLNALIAKIDDLRAKYKERKKAKGLLVALKQYRKQAVKLNKKIDYLKAHPPVYNNGKLNEKKADRIIKFWTYKELVLEKKVAKKAKLLAKLKIKT